MAVFEFLKKHTDAAVRIAVAIALCAVTAAFIIAFRAGVLPHSEDGDAFDTIYAIEKSENVGTTESN